MSRSDFSLFLNCDVTFLNQGHVLDIDLKNQQK